MSVVIFAFIAGVGIFLGAIAYFKHLMKKAHAIWESNRQTVKGEFPKSRIGVKGSHAGRPVFARIEQKSQMDNTTISFADEQPAMVATYAYLLSMTFSVSGADDWRIRFSGKGFLKNVEAKRWRVQSSNKMLADRLEAAGVLATFDRTWPADAEINYKARKGELTMHYSVKDQYYCPDTALFRTQLNLMQDLAACYLAVASMAA